MRILFDAEGDGLNPTRFWCFTLMDIDTREITEYGPKDINKAIDHLLRADVLIGHNIIGYDLPFILKLHNVNLFDKELIDTLVISRLANPNREGGHSLEAWGNKLGFHKVEHEDWSKYSKDMQNRCTMDVRLNLKVHLKLAVDTKNFSPDSIKLEHDVAKILKDQQDYGWLFNLTDARILQATINDVLGEAEDAVRETFKPKQFLVKVVTPKTKKDGTLSKSGLNDEEYAKIIESGDMSPFPRYRTQVFNLGSREQIGIWLQDFGWKPTVFTEGSKEKAKEFKDKSLLKPKMDETILEAIDEEAIPEAKIINRYLSLTRIAGFLTNWIDSVGEDGRQHGYVNPMGAVTGRMSHSKPNLAQVPSSRKEFGAECRKLFIVPKGYKLVGMDASGLELRMLAHYMNDPNFIHTVLNGSKEDGTDPHSVLAHMAGLSTRDEGKTLYYAYMYGAGDAKVGKIVNGTKKEGKRIKHDLGSNLPDLPDLIERVHSAASRGYIKGLDGRLIHVRAVYASLNTLLQGAGAIVMKRALVILRDLADAENLDYHFVGNVHDEIQSEVLEEHSERFAELAEEAMKLAGEYYNMNIPLAGEAAIGDHWGQTH